MKHDSTQQDNSEQDAGIVTFPCAQCGAKLRFDPGSATLECSHCGHQNAIPESTATVREQDFNTILTKMADAEDSTEHISVKCESCGAEINNPEQLASFPCPFCGSSIVATQKTKRLIKPKALLPFAIERDTARGHYQKWIKSRWFAPNALKQFARLQQRLNGTYVPFWTYDALTTSHYTGQRGEHYYVTVGSGKNRRQVRKTRWYHASGSVRNHFDDILIIASNSLPRKYAVKLEPWDLNNLIPYDDAYLSGFTSESYQIDVIDGFAQATQIMKREIERTVRWDIGGDEQRIFSIDTHYDNITFKHILLPIWISAYRYKDKTYRFLVNARTGEVQGERPWSWIKITTAILAGLVIIAMVTLYLQSR